MSLRDRLLNTPAPTVAAVVRTMPEQLGYCPDCGERLTRENSSQLVSGGIRHVKCLSEPPAVLPPDAPPPEPVQTVQEVTPAPVQPAHASEPEQPAPKRRGRPRKAAAAQQPAPAAESEHPAPAPEQPAPSSSPKTDRRVLFVDCVPTAFDGPTPEPLTTYVDAMHRQVAEAGGVDDVRFAGSDSPLGFGKWRGALAMAVRAELPKPGVYVVLGLAHSELMQVVVEAIEPAFDVVVRSVR